MSEATSRDWAQEEPTAAHRDTIDLSALPPLLTLRESAKVMGIGHAVAYRMDARGELPTFGTASRRVVKVQLLEMLGLSKSGDDTPTHGGGTARRRDGREGASGACARPPATPTRRASVTRATDEADP